MKLFTSLSFLDFFSFLPANSDLCISRVGNMGASNTMFFIFCVWIDRALRVKQVGCRGVFFPVACCQDSCACQRRRFLVSPGVVSYGCVSELWNHILHCSESPFLPFPPDPSPLTPSPTYLWGNEWQTSLYAGKTKSPSRRGLYC